MFKKTKLISVLIVISLVVILSLPLSSSANIKIKLIDFFSPVVKASKSLTENIFSIKDLFNAVKENKNLRKDVQRLSARCNELEEEFQENQRLKQLLDVRKQIVNDTVVCRVIARDASTWHKTFVLDKGKNSGIYINMPVVNSKGVIGRIIECDDDTSRVLLITDANSSIGGITQDARVPGLVEGDGSDLCIFNLLSRKEDIIVGVPVVTNGLSQIFPKGLKIGSVTEIKKSNDGLYKTAKISLSADLDRVEEVLVIKTRNLKSSLRQGEDEASKARN
jgi:rod shape-determining protein MreC